MMTDIDMKNCHPVILLWICDKFGIDCPVLRKYVGDREFHLTEDLNTRWLTPERFLVPAMTFLARTLGDPV